MTAAGVVADAGTATLGPVVWTVLALLMGLGSAAVAVSSWRFRRALGHRTRCLVGATEQRSPSRVRLSGADDLPIAGAAARTGGRVGRRIRRGAVREVATALGGLAAGAVALGGTAGWSVGVAAGLAGWQWQRRRARLVGQDACGADSTTVERQLPLAAELLAACLAAGSGPAQAAEAVGRSTGGPLGDRLVRVAAELRLGGEPADVWGRFGSSPGCEGLARCMERAGTTGVPPVQAVARLAAERRARRARAAAARARRAAVQVTGPLGLCFLPAFLAIGVAPVVLGLARSLL